MPNLIRRRFQVGVAATLGGDLQAQPDQVTARLAAAGDRVRGPPPVKHLQLVCSQCDSDACYLVQVVFLALSGMALIIAAP